jgi:hypothetical protein
VQNSWGPNWGKDGYAYVNRSMESDCGITKYANFFKTGMNVTEYPKEMVKITINMTDSKKNGWGWILGIRQNNVIVSNLSLTTATGNG